MQYQTVANILSVIMLEHFLGNLLDNNKCKIHKQTEY